LQRAQAEQTSKQAATATGQLVELLKLGREEHLLPVLQSPRDWVTSQKPSSAADSQERADMAIITEVCDYDADDGIFF
jgi:hypothetical protein